MGTNVAQLTTVDGSETGASGASAWVPLLTVLAHPQSARVGQVAWLNNLLAPGRSVQVSRTQPAFGPLGQAAADALNSPLISRRPVTFRRSLSGHWSLDPGELSGKVYADGVVLTAPLKVDAHRLDAGVVLRFGRHVVFLWHRAAQTERSNDNLGLQGDSAPMDQLRARIRQLAQVSGSVLIRGETGSGKELVAAALHRQSRRRGNFVAVNLGAIAQSLAASELFGHSRGAFTGASSARDGFFVQANRGTLLLDEIGDAADDVQLALLRVLETGEIQPVGANAATRVDTRVLAATDADLEQKMAAGQFRSPLYHRLATHLLTVPALRDRRDDVGRLLVYFLRKELENLGKPHLLDTDVRAKHVWLSAKVVERLACDRWSGNVRQLRNVARYLAGKSLETGALQVDDPDLQRLLSVSEPVASPKPTPTPGLRRPRDIGPDELADALQQVDWQLGRAAERFGISRVALNALVDQHPTLKRAQFLTADEIALGRSEAEASGQALWQVLKVSKRSLSIRLRSLQQP